MARLDSWLWAVRMYKTRSMATAAVRGGHVRVDDKLAKASQHVVTGQKVRLRKEQDEKLLEVVDPTLEKRVGAPLAQAAAAGPITTRRTAAIWGEAMAGVAATAEAATSFAASMRVRAAACGIARIDALAGGAEGHDLIGLAMVAMLHAG